MDKLLVTIFGAAAISFIFWFFFGGRQKTGHEMHHEH